MGKKVIVTTSHRGVFFGTLVSSHNDGKRVVLDNARMAIYWATSRGLFELAEVGPSSRSKISAAAPQIDLQDVVSIIACTDAAVAAWEK